MCVASIPSQAALAFALLVTVPVSAQQRTDRAGDPLPPGAIARIGTLRFRDTGPILGLGFLPDGKTLLASGWGGGPRFWDVATGKPLGFLDEKAGQSGYYRRLFVARNGKAAVYTAVHNGQEYYGIIDPVTRKSLDTTHLGPPQFLGTLRETRSLAFSADNRIIATASHVGEPIYLWEPGSGREARKLAGHEPFPMMAGQGIITALDFAPDGKTLASAGGPDKTIRVWDVGSGKQVFSRVVDSIYVRTLAYSSDGKTLAVTGYDGVVQLWDPSVGKLIRTLPRQDGWVNGLRYSSDGRLLAASMQGGRIVLWDVAAGVVRYRLPGHPGSSIFATTSELAFSPDGRTLASCGEDQAIRLWDVSSGKEILPGGISTYPVALDLSHDGRTVVTADMDWGIRFWDVDTGREVKRLSGSVQPFSRVRFLLGGKGVAAEGDAAVCVWDQAGTERVPLLRRGDTWRRPTAVSADGRVFALGEGVILRIVGEDGRERHRLEDPGRAFIGAEFAPDSRTLATVTEGLVSTGYTDHKVALWDVESGVLLRRVSEGPVTPCHLAFSPDSRTLAVADAWGEFALLEAATGRVRWQITYADRKGLSALRFSPCGRVLALGGWQPDSMRLLDLATGRELARLEGHGGGVQAVAFSGDGRRLASLNRNTTALIWDVADPMSAAAAPALLAPRELEAAWADLASADAARAWAAVWRLGRAPERAAAFLAARLKPAAVERADIGRLIAALDSPRFAERERAMARLRELSEAAWPELRRCLTADVPLEVRRRAEQLLAAEPSGESLRSLRAVEALGQMRTDEARRALEALAAGDRAAPLTRAAAAALALTR